MSLLGSNHRLYEGSYATNQTDMQTRYAGQVQYGPRDTGGSGAVRIRQQGQPTRDIVEDGIEDSRPLEDGTGQV